MTAQIPSSLDTEMSPPFRPEAVVVLLVDDQPMVGEAVRRALINEVGAEFHYCSKATEALATAREVRPTVILQDLVMPDTNGLELVRQFRADPDTAHIPIIVLSTKEEAMVKSSAFRAGANDYLVKLPDQVELIARIRYHSAAYLSQIQRDEAYRALHRSQQELIRTNLELERLTNVDGLTGLSNRRYFNQFFETEWKQALRVEAPVSLLMLDVDRFKQYNDGYGHLAGDEVLKIVAQTVKRSFRRPRDLAARYGGEEFAVILPQTAGGELVLLAEKVVRAVEALDLPHSGATAGKVTVSAGGATIIPSTGDPYTTLIEVADKALYEAKRTGRNRAVISSR